MYLTVSFFVKEFQVRFEYFPLCQIIYVPEASALFQIDLFKIFLDLAGD